jgi:hypothetical protein
MSESDMMNSYHKEKRPVEMPRRSAAVKSLPEIFPIRIMRGANLVITDYART